VCSIRENGILTWTFNPCELPDSATDPINSQGYVSFEVRLKSNLPNGTAIINTADIYFDYNAAVVTNTVYNAIDLCVGVNNTTTITANIMQDSTYHLPGGGLANVAGTYYDTLRSVNNCDSVIITHLSVIAGIDENVAANFNLWPNPAEDHLHISSSANVKEIRVYSVMGQLLQIIAAPKSLKATEFYYNLEVGKLAAGTYLVEIKTVDSALRRRWIKL
jgi:hypothetical protein